MRDDFDANWRFQTHYYAHFIENIQRCRRVEVACAADDLHRNTDFVTFDDSDGHRWACRVRRPLPDPCQPWQADWVHQFTIRTSVPGGAPTEIDKVRAGWGDWMQYGWAEPFDVTPSGLMDRWAIFKLGDVRRYLEADGRWLHIRNDDGTTGLAIYLDDLQASQPGSVPWTYGHRTTWSDPPDRAAWRYGWDGLTVPRSVQPRLEF
jgi:hypothetical protein